jgi:twitching motility protein PilT
VAVAGNLNELPFADLYLGHPSLSDRFSAVPGGDANPLPAGDALRDDVAGLVRICREECDASPRCSEFGVRYGGVFYRVTLLSVPGGSMFVVRKTGGRVWSLAEMGVPQAYAKRLLRNDLSGLFIVSGTAGAGKTTAACALIKDRLTLHGGIAVTRERAFELPLEGVHGKGICYQTQVHAEESGTGNGAASFAHCGARMVLIDEVRDGETAMQALRAGVDGQLIITTIRAGSMVQAVAKLNVLVRDRMSSDEARILLAEGLLGVLHLRLEREAKPALVSEFLFLKEARHMKWTIRDGNYDALESEMRKQMAMMIADSGPMQKHHAG